MTKELIYEKLPKEIERLVNKICDKHIYVDNKKYKVCEVVCHAFCNENFHGMTPEMMWKRLEEYGMSVLYMNDGKCLRLDVKKIADKVLGESDALETTDMLKALKIKTAAKEGCLFIVISMWPVITRYVKGKTKEDKDGW